MTESSAGDVQTGETTEVRVIQHVENFCTKLDLQVVVAADAKPQIFRHREINSEGRRSEDDAASGSSRIIGVAECRRVVRVQRISLEAGGVKPLVAGMRRVLIRIAKQIRSCRRIGVD